MPFLFAHGINRFSITHRVMHSKDADGMANRLDADQQSDLGLHCLSRPVCPKT